MERVVTTLVVIQEDQKVLLAMKKRGFGVGRWNGLGGKLKEGETLEEAARRETEEEIGIQLSELVKVGAIDFEFTEDPKIIEVNIFRVSRYVGEPSETEEMAPRWFHISEIPYHEMWPDDAHWMPLFLAGKKFKGRFLFDKPSTKEYTSQIIEKDLREVESLDDSECL